MQRILFIFFICAVSTHHVSAQTQQSVQTYNGAQVSKKIAQTLQDSLRLDGKQKKQLEDVNMLLHTQKMNVRTQFAGQDSLVRRNIQAVENTRDSLYRPILGEEKYKLYRQMKYKLLRAN